MNFREVKWVEQKQPLEQRSNFRAKLMEQQTKVSNQQREVNEQKNWLDQEVRDLEAEQQQIQALKSVPIPSGTSTSTTAEVSNVNFCCTIGTLSEFRVGENWNIYEERLNQYFIANKVPVGRWVAVLITQVGQEAYTILKDLCDPDLPSTKTYVELCEILKQQFTPSVIVFKERREFYNMTQNESESVNDWFARLKSKAVNCKFGAQLDDKLKDGFVSGLKSGPVLDMVFEQSASATLQAILEVARSKEASIAISSRSNTSEIHKITSKYSKGGHRRGTSLTKMSTETTSKQHPGNRSQSRQSSRRSISRHSQKRSVSQYSSRYSASQHSSRRSPCRQRSSSCRARYRSPYRYSSVQSSFYFLYWLSPSLDSMCHYYFMM